MKEPSEKQVSFARSISFVTKVPLPEEETAQAYFIYIRDNIERYKCLRRCAIYELQREREYEKQKRKMYNSIMDDEQDAAWAAAMDFSWM